MDSSSLLSNFGERIDLKVSLLQSPPSLSLRSKTSFVVGCNLALFLCHFSYQIDGGTPPAIAPAITPHLDLFSYSVVYFLHLFGPNELLQVNGTSLIDGNKQAGSRWRVW
jgi:hypothetical protein